MKKQDGLADLGMTLVELVFATVAVAVAVAAPLSLDCEVNVVTVGAPSAGSARAFCVDDHPTRGAPLCQPERQRSAAGPKKFCVQADAGLGKTSPCPRATSQTLTLLHGGQPAFPYQMYRGCYPVSATSMNRTMRTATLDASAPTSARWRALMHPDGQRNVTILVLGGSVAAAVGMKGGGHAARWARWLSWMSGGKRTFRVVNHAHSGTNVFWLVNNLHEVFKAVEPGTRLVVPHSPSVSIKHHHHIDQLHQLQHFHCHFHCHFPSPTQTSFWSILRPMISSHSPMSPRSAHCEQPMRRSYVGSSPSLRSPRWCTSCSCAVLTNAKCSTRTRSVKKC